MLGDDVWRRWAVKREQLYVEEKCKRTLEGGDKLFGGNQSNDPHELLAGAASEEGGVSRL